MYQNQSLSIASQNNLQSIHRIIDTIYRKVNLTHEVMNICSFEDSLIHPNLMNENIGTSISLKVVLQTCQSSYNL